MNNHLKDYRKFFFTQNDLALKLNVTRQTISKWETEKSEPDIDSLIHLSHIFTLSFEEVASWFSNEELDDVPKSFSNSVEKRYHLLICIELVNMFGIFFIIIFLFFNL